jgi:hypothetical protein
MRGMKIYEIKPDHESDPFEREFLVDGTDSTREAINAPGIPRFGESILVNGIERYCDLLRVEMIAGFIWEVTASFVALDYQI